MLTRLKVNGFKNLVDVDVRFGPFTCIAGANGVGKSNLFDAIRFLSDLANEPSLSEAAKLVREGETSKASNLFHQVGEHVCERMSFMAEMIVPRQVKDQMGQIATSKTTFLRYSLDLALRKGKQGARNSIEIKNEELVSIRKGEAPKLLLFPYERDWFNSVIRGPRKVPIISTQHKNTDRAKIQLHSDPSDTRSGQARVYKAESLPGTLLSSQIAASNPTAVIARNEMQSWQLLQLEPSAMRESDDFEAVSRVGNNGANLAATLFRLAWGKNQAFHTNDPVKRKMAERVFAQVANRLSELIDDIREVGIDTDEQNEMWSIVMTALDGTAHPARALSDGTLRFLALAVMELDPTGQGLLCLEEPENGIHPDRIPAMLRLIQDIATDTSLPVDTGNPLRQVIINTHSPSIVRAVPADSLVIVESKETLQGGRSFRRASFGSLPQTWRAKGEGDIAPLGMLLGYLSPHDLNSAEAMQKGDPETPPLSLQKSPSVAQHADVQRMLNFGEIE
jgi:predicted ATPase